MAGGEDDVTIKLAADIDSAMRALFEVIAGFKDVTEAVTFVEAAAKTAGVSTQTFLVGMNESLEKSSVAGTAFGNTVAAAFVQIGDTLAGTKSNIEDVTVNLKGMSESGIRAGQILSEGLVKAAGSAEQAVTSIADLATKTKAYRDEAGASAAYMAALSTQEKEAFVALAEAMLAVGRSMQDVSKETGLTVDQIKELIAEQERLTAATTEQIDPVEQLAEVTKGYREQEAADIARVNALSNEEVVAIAAATEEMLKHGVSLQQVAEKSNLTAGSLELIRKKADEINQPGLFDQFLHGVKESEAATITWGVVMADVLKQLAEGLRKAIAAFPGMVTNIAKMGEELQATANRLGLTTDKVEELQYISKSANVEFSAVSRTIQTFGIEASKTGSKAKKALGDIGLSMKEMRAEGLSNDEMFLKIIKRIQDTVPASEQGATAIAIFGKKFASQTGLMTERIGDLQARFKELTGPNGGLAKTAEGGNKFGNLLNDLTVKTNAFKASIVGNVIGPLNVVAKTMIDTLPASVLTLGQAMAEGASSMVPMMSNLVILAGKERGIMGLASSLKNLIPTIWATTTAFIAQAAAFLLTPWGLVAAAVAVLGVALYKMMGGWEGVTKAFDAAMEALKPVIQFFKDLYDILRILGPDAFGAVVKWVKEAWNWLAKLWTSTKEGTSFVNRLLDTFKSIPIIGLYVTAFQKVWGALFTIVKKVGGFILGIMKALGVETAELANRLREEEKAQEKNTEAKEESVVATKKQLDATDELLAKTKFIEERYKALTAAQKSQIKTLLQDNDVKEVATAMADRLGLEIEDAIKVIERYDKALKASAQEAKKDPYAKFVKDLKELGAAMEAASNQGFPLTTLVAKFGKEASDIVSKAALSGHLADVSEKIKLVAATFESEQLAEKLKPINEKALELARTLSDKVTTGAQSAATALKNMVADAEEALLTGDALKERQIQRALDNQLAGFEAQKTALDQQNAELLVKYEKLADDRIEAEKKALEEKNKVITQERIDQIRSDAQFEAEVAIARNNNLKDQYTAAQELAKQDADFKRKLETATTGNYEVDAKARGLISEQAAKEELAREKRKLELMEDARSGATKVEIREQKRKIKELENLEEKNLRQLGIKTKAQTRQTLRDEQDKLDALKALHDPYYDDQIRAQQRVVDEAARQAGQLVINWEMALGKLSDAFNSLGTMFKDVGDGTLGKMFQEGGGIMKGLQEWKVSGTKWGNDYKDMMNGQADSMTRINGAVKIGMNVAQGVQDVMAATDKRTRGQRALGGAMAGAKAGAAFGPYGMAVGAAAGLVVGLIRGKPAWAKATDEIGKNFGLKVSDEMGKVIAKEAKEKFKGDRFTAEISNLDKLIAEGGGITEKNFDQLTSRLGDTFRLVKEGKLKADEGREVLDKNFGTFAQHVLESGKLASKGFQDIIKQNQESGLKSEQVTAFVLNQTQRLGGNVAQLVKAAVATKDVGDQMGRLERLTMASFNASIKGGAGYLEALDAMAPALDEIIKANKTLGRESSGAVQELLRFREVADTNRDLVESAGSLNEIMLALSNVGGLTTETMADLQAQGNETFASLQAAGFTEMQSLQQMKPFLESVRKAHKEMGLPIDENTAKMIEQAEASGVLAAEQMSTNDILMDGMSALIEALGGKLPESFKKAAEAGVAAGDTIGRGFQMTVNAELDDTTKKLKDTPWAGYAAKGVAASSAAKTGVDKVGRAADGVSDSLEDTDWQAWSDEAVRAAKEAEDAVNAVSMGHSPGGIKEIPIKLFAAMRAFKEWERQGVISSKAVEDAIGGVEHTSESVARMNRAISDDSMQTSFAYDAKQSVLAGIVQDMGERMEEAVEAATAEKALNVAITTIDAQNMEQAVEGKILPAIEKAIRNNRHQTRSNLRQVLGVRGVQ